LLQKKKEKRGRYCRRQYSLFCLELFHKGSPIERSENGNPIFHLNVSQVAHYQQSGVCELFAAPKFGAICDKSDLKKLLRFDDMYPFKRAKLNDCGGNLSGRWYIEFMPGMYQIYEIWTNIFNQLYFSFQLLRLINERFYDIRNTGGDDDGFA
jgi:hypothetical protein